MTTPRIKPPASGVKVRMYRQGHGDCFLLAFRKGRARRAYFVLIDCGCKSKSMPADLSAHDVTVHDVIEEIYKDCGGRLDLVVVTHEHQDHVSGFPKIGEDDHPFAKFEMRELWLAWTEDPDDPFARDLRERYNDTLLTLAMIHEKRLRLKGLDSEADVLTDEIGDFLETETGHSTGADVIREMAIAMDVAPADIAAGPDTAFAAASAAKRIPGKRYKERLQGLRRLITDDNIRYLSPEDGPWALPGMEEVRVYPFGPPRNEKLLKSLNPRKAEEFHIGPFELGSPGAGLAASLAADASPFAPRYVIEEAAILDPDPLDVPDARIYFEETYLAEDAAFRRIDGDYLGEAEGLALRINSEVNNTSLVLCFELIESGRTLLFTGDAQRGSWTSWADLHWDVDGAKVTVRDLLARCSLYKVGHHGSHNATLNGTIEDAHPNLSWMAHGDYAQDFAAMVPANKSWAWGKTRPWRHPMAAIEDALAAKAKGGLLLIDPVENLTPGERRFAVEHWVPDTKPGAANT